MVCCPPRAHALGSRLPEKIAASRRKSPLPAKIAPGKVRRRAGGYRIDTLSGSDALSTTFLAARF